MVLAKALKKKIQWTSLLKQQDVYKRQVWNSRATAAAARGDEKGMFRNHVIGAQITNFVIRAIPVSIAIYSGKGFVNFVVNNVPDWILHAMDVLGGIDVYKRQLYKFINQRRKPLTK